MGEPAENPAPPKHRRRRWLIVALLLVLVSGVAWCWPTIDQSLVGKWKISGHRIEIEGGDSGLLWLRADGTGQVESPYSHTLSRIFEWRTVAGHLEIDIPSRSGFSLWDRAMSWAYASTGSKFFRGADKYAVHRYYDNGTLHLAAWSGLPVFLPGNCFLERIPE